jgi:hypothetical protein
MKTASEEVTDMIFLSKWSSQTLCAGAELGVFDCLSREGARTASDVAAETALDPRLLYRLLRALASLGLLNETPGRHFNLTERGAVLRTDAPGSLRYMAMLEGGPEHWAIWKHVARDGQGRSPERIHAPNTAKWRSTTHVPILTVMARFSAEPCRAFLRFSPRGRSKRCAITTSRQLLPGATSLGVTAT